MTDAKTPEAAGATEALARALQEALGKDEWYALLPSDAAVAANRLRRRLRAKGYEVRPIDPDPGSDQYEAGWKAGWADRDRHPTPIHSVTAEAEDSSLGLRRGPVPSGPERYGPSAAADLPTGSAEAGGLDVLAIEREAGQSAWEAGWIAGWEARYDNNRVLSRYEIKDKAHRANLARLAYAAAREAAK